MKVSKDSITLLVKYSIQSLVHGKHSITLILLVLLFYNTNITIIILRKLYNIAILHRIVVYNSRV